MMVCQHCGWHSLSRKSEKESCPICGECYETPRIPPVERRGHRMPWMMYLLALRDLDTAFNEAVDSEEMDIIEAASRANMQKLDLHPTFLHPYPEHLSIDEMLEGINRMRIRLSYCRELRESGVWAITNPEDLKHPTPMDEILGTMGWYLPIWEKEAARAIALN